MSVKIDRFKIKAVLELQARFRYFKTMSEKLDKECQFIYKSLFDMMTQVQTNYNKGIISKGKFGILIEHVEEAVNEYRTLPTPITVNSLLQSGKLGELMLNINTPPTWNGKFQTTRLGMRWYRDAISFAETSDNENTATFTIGAASIDHTPVENSDCDAVIMDESSISCLPTWPQTHPLAIDDRLLTWCLKTGEDNYPIWLKI